MLICADKTKKHRILYLFPFKNKLAREINLSWASLFSVSEVVSLLVTGCSELPPRRAGAYRAVG